MEPAVTCYREYAPHPALRGHIRALFSFGPVRSEPGLAHRITREVRFGAGAAYSATFADGDGSIVIESRTGAVVMGAMSHAGAAHGPDLPEMVGVYFQPAQAPAVTRVPGRVLADRVVPLEELWGREGRELPLCLERLEAILLRRLGADQPGPLLDLLRLLEWIRAEQGRISVERLAQAAGVSRQYLTRVFGERIGVTPKRYCRIARFQAALGYLAGPRADWARAAAECGYADQSHLIAEFRELSSLTPHQLASERRFHPFIERARRGEPLRTHLQPFHGRSGPTYRPAP